MHQQQQHAPPIANRLTVSIELSVEAQGATRHRSGALLDAGATLFTVGVDGPEYELSDLQRWVNWRNSL